MGSFVDELHAEALEHYAAGRLDEAQRACETILAVDPHAGPACERLGRIAERRGALATAVTWLERAIPLLDAPAECHHALGLVLHRLGQGEAALGQYRQAEALGLVHPAVSTNAGIILRELGRLEEAVAEQRKAHALAPTAAPVLVNLGATLGLAGRVDEGLVYLREAVRLDPGNLTAHSNLLLFLLYSDTAPKAEHLERSLAVGALFADAAEPLPDPGGPRGQDGRLRVGLLSPDLRQHAVASFLRPLVRHRDRTRVELVAYADLPEADAVTGFFRDGCEGFRDVFGLPDEVLLAQIRADRIDLLVDLAGHTARNRLGVFARRAAPVQVAYLGYPATTGLGAMDIRLTDAWADPLPGAAGRYTEALVHLPRGFLVYEPPAGAPPVTEPPHLRPEQAGRITFGCFNNLAKLSPCLLEAWAALLHRLPQARLVLKNKSLGDPGTLAQVACALTAFGIESERVLLRPPLAGESDHLAAYGDIDIALDSYPYHGTTTTCEALWMGVPVVTWVGECHHSRVGRSILEQAGLAELAADSEQDYVDRAVALAGDPSRLRDLRAGLRRRLAASALLDGPGQAGAFFTALADAFAHRRAS